LAEFSQRPLPRESCGAPGHRSMDQDGSGRTSAGFVPNGDVDNRHVFRVTVALWCCLSRASVKRCGTSAASPAHRVESSGVPLAAKEQPFATVAPRELVGVVHGYGDASDCPQIEHQVGSLPACSRHSLGLMTAGQVVAVTADQRSVQFCLSMHAGKRRRRPQFLGQLFGGGAVAVECVA
jgi:hypothetical protein